jgi:low affinity Fe/Cu permease
MEENPAAKSRHSTDGPRGFEKFVDAINHRISRAPFLGVIVVALLLWALSKPFWGSTTKWELGLHTGSSILSLMLLVLLENAGRRGEEASQEKLNVIAEALSDLMVHQSGGSAELDESVRRLREAVGLEERH